MCMHAASQVRLIKWRACMHAAAGERSAIVHDGAHDGTQDGAQSSAAGIEQRRPAPLGGPPSGQQPSSSRVARLSREALVWVSGEPAAATSPSDNGTSGGRGDSSSSSGEGSCSVTFGSFALLTQTPLLRAVTVHTFLQSLLVNSVW